MDKIESFLLCLLFIIMLCLPLFGGIVFAAIYSVGVRKLDPDRNKKDSGILLGFMALHLILWGGVYYGIA